MPVHYTYKESPYSSHALMLGMVSQQGRGKRLLDVGCGNGYLAERFAAKGYEVTGIERPEGVSRPFPPEVKLILADLEQGLPPLEPGFDYIVCGDVLEHLRDPFTMLRNLAQLLRPDGNLVVSLPNSGNLYFRLVVLSGRFPKQDRGFFDRTHLHFFTWDGWCELFQSAGLNLHGVRVSGIPVGLQFPRWDGSAAVRLAEWLSYQLARVWKTMFAFQFVAFASRSDANHEG